MAGLEPTPSPTMHHDAVSEVDSATAEHVVTVSSILGSGGNDSTVVASNLALASREQPRPKNAEDATKLDVIAAPDSREQVSQLCKYVLAYLITSIVLLILRVFSVLSHWIMQTNSLDNIPSGGYLLSCRLIVNFVIVKFIEEVDMS